MNGIDVLEQDGLDRLVHNAHRIEMRGESMRKKRNPQSEDKPEKEERQK